MNKRFAIVRTIKYYEGNRFHKPFTRFKNIIVSQREYEKLYGYDRFFIKFQSDSYDECLNFLMK